MKRLFMTLDFFYPSYHFSPLCVCVCVCMWRKKKAQVNRVCASLLGFFCSYAILPMLALCLCAYGCAEVTFLMWKEEEKKREEYRNSCRLCVKMYELFPLVVGIASCVLAGRERRRTWRRGQGKDYGWLAESLTHVTCI